MAIIVKNTTENSIIDIVCPYYCMGCGRLGSLLCGRCKKHIFDEQLAKGVQKTNSVITCGDREGLLFEMVKRYKYGPVRGFAEVLAGLMADVIPCLGEVVIVPLPTIGRHVRERGFDHIDLLARKLGRRRGWKRAKVLGRANSTVQVGAGAETRRQQAKGAYELTGAVSGDMRYLLVDDVWTTGASMGAAERVLRAAGAREVYRAVVVGGRV